MAEQQRTFGDKVGMEPVVQTARLPLDLVECSDGTLRHHEDVHYDCRDNPHGTEEDRHEADVEIVTEVLDQVGKHVTEYCTENTDYADMYSHIIDEVSHDWPDRVKEWLGDEYGDNTDALVESICDGLQGSFDAEPEYSANEYAAYSGDGCCLWGTDIGEHEEQIDISCFDDLQELNSRGDLNDALDDVNCDVYVGSRVRKGDNTFEVYLNPGGRWDWVVSNERMNELLTAAIIDVAGRIK